MSENWPAWLWHPKYYVFSLWQSQMIINNAKQLFHGCAISQRNWAWVSKNVQPNGWGDPVVSCMTGLPTQLSTTWCKNRPWKTQVPMDGWMSAYIFIFSEYLESLKQSGKKKHWSSLLCLLVFTCCGSQNCPNEPKAEICTHTYIYIHHHLCLHIDL
jgi:hypothetical protein